MNNTIGNIIRNPAKKLSFILFYIFILSTHIIHF
jgi:hypothetical protein